MKSSNECMKPPEEVLDRIGWTLYRDFQLYNILVEAKHTKPGYKKFSELQKEMEIELIPQLASLLRRNQIDETIKKELIKDPTEKNEKMAVYSILPKGENVLVAIKQLYKAFTGKELEYTKPTHS